MSKKWLTIGLAAASAMTIFLSSCQNNGDAESSSKTNPQLGDRVFPLKLSVRIPMPIIP